MGAGSRLPRWRWAWPREPTKPSICQAAKAVREDDQRIPGNSVQAGRHGYRDRRGAPLVYRAAWLADQRPRFTRNRAWPSFTPVRWRARGQRSRTDPRRIRLHQGLSRRKVYRDVSSAPSAKARAKSKNWLLPASCLARNKPCLGVVVEAKKSAQFMSWLGPQEEIAFSVDDKLAEAAFGNVGMARGIPEIARELSER